MALRKSKTSGATAVAFRVTWKAQKGDSAWLGQSSKRGRQELVVGDVWASIGQASFEADALRFVQPDFQEPSTLHLGFVHLRKERSIALQFAEAWSTATAPSRCSRALHDRRPVAPPRTTANATSHRPSTRGPPCSARRPQPPSSRLLAATTRCPAYLLLLRPSIRLANVGGRPSQRGDCLPCRVRVGRAHAHLSFKHLDASKL